MANTNRTFLALQEAVQTEMQLDPGLISDGERKQFINEGIHEIGGDNLFEKTVSLTTSEGIVDIPDDFITLHGLFWNNIPLTPATNTFTDSRTSTPTHFVVRYDTIELIPHPVNEADEVKMHYTYQPTPLSASTDQPEIPNGWDRLLVDYAVSRAHRKNGNVGLAREYMSTFDYQKSKLALEMVRRLNSRITETVNSDYANNPSTPFDFLF